MAGAVRVRADNPRAHHGEGDDADVMWQRSVVQTFAVQPDTERDTHDRVHDDDEGLRDAERTDVERRLLTQQIRRRPDDKGVHRPAGEGNHRSPGR